MPMPPMEEKTIPSALPLYAAAAVYAVLAAVLPIQQWWAILIAAAAAAAAWAVARKKIPPRKVLVPAGYRTGSEELDRMLEAAGAHLDALHRLNAQIPDPALSDAIARMERAGAAIVKKLSAEPDKARAARRFLTYYLPTAVKVLAAYAELEAAGAEGANAQALAGQVQQNAGTIARAFEAQLDSLYAGQVLDVSTDLDVLEAMAQSDGLTRPDSKTL